MACCISGGLWTTQWFQSKVTRAAESPDHPALLGHRVHHRQGGMNGKERRRIRLHRRFQPFEASVRVRGEGTDAIGTAASIGGVATGPNEIVLCGRGHRSNLPTSAAVRCNCGLALDSIRPRPARLVETPGSQKGVPLPVSGISAPHPFAATVSALRAAGCVFAEDEAGLLISEAPGPAALAEWVGRRRSGEPLEYILGWAGFDGHRIAVEPGVFVPRRRTRLLVDEAVGLLQGGRFSAPRIVVDLCCGSGAVGAAIARRDPGIELHAADVDPVAAKCARRNVGPVGGRVYEGDLFAALPPGLQGRVRVLAVNAPYVPTDAIRTMPPEARLYESRTALDGGPDGLHFHRRVAAGSLEWLSSDGHLLIETSEQQAEGTASVVAAAGLAVRTVHSDELDGTVVIGSAGVGSAGVGAAGPGTSLA